MRDLIYDILFARITRSWYAAVLCRVERGSRLLDIGIGTGSSLLANSDAIEQRDLSITGIDIEREYLSRCRQRLEGSRLVDRVAVLEEPLSQHHGGPYDAVYFSGSFMLFSEQHEALQQVKNLVRRGGPVFFTQTFHHHRSRLAEQIKPRLGRLTTIEFGTVTYREGFIDTLAGAGFEVTHEQVLSSRSRSSFRLIEAHTVNGHSTGVSGIGLRIPE